MGNIRDKRNRKTLMSIIMGTICGIGIGILILTICVLIFLSEVASRNLFQPAIFSRIETAIVIGYLCITIVLIFLFPLLTTRKLRKKGRIVLEITNKIKNQNLDFKIESSDIKEIDLMLEAMDDMRVTLKESLENQWRLEQNRKGQISALAHDFKTPITVVKGNLDLLRSNNLDDVSKEYVEDARACIEQMEIYLTQLLEMTRAESGYKINLEKINLYELVDKTVSLLEFMAFEKKITISIDKEIEDIFILADRILLERVLNNLLSNALDFTPLNGTIKILLTIEDKAAVVSIIDSGNGFKVNVLKHGKEQFYMDDTGRSRENHYGLGLYIADSIIKQHGGTMVLDNDSITGGAKVIIKLPLIKE